MIFTTTIDVAVVLIFFLKGNIDIKPASLICNDRKSAIIQSATPERISSKNSQKKWDLIAQEKKNMQLPKKILLGNIHQSQLKLYQNKDNLSKLPTQSELPAVVNENLVREEQNRFHNKKSPSNFSLTKREQPQSAINVAEAVRKSKRFNITQARDKKPETRKKEIELRLSDLVMLALENNRDIKNAYLDRIAQRTDLKVAEDIFIPDFTPILALQRNADTTGISGFDLLGRVSMRIPTGGNWNFSWGARDPAETNTTLRQTIELSFSQPFLRGAGIDVNRASIEIARLTETSNILSLKSTLLNTITSAILAYRNLLQAKERVEIESISLERARQFLDINQVLIEAGRLAPVEIVQNQTEVANREVSLIEAQNNFESAMLALIEILDIGKNFRIVPTEPLVIEEKLLDVEKLKQLAFENRPDYLQAQLTREIEKLTLLQAKNNRLWGLDLDANYRQEFDREAEWTVGLNLSKTFGDRTLEQAVQQSQVNLLKAENTLENIRETVEIEVEDQVRDVNLRFSQVKLAQQARELSANQLEIEREKLRLGRSSIFQIVNFQNDLVTAQNNELDAIIGYFNALTRLDQTLGTTLDTWNVTIEENSD